MRISDWSSDVCSSDLVVDAESLGGAEVHTSISGVADHFAENDRHALEIARETVHHLNRRKVMLVALQASREPAYPAEDLYGIVPHDTRRPYDVSARLARLVHRSELPALNAPSGQTWSCGFTSRHGYPVRPPA